MRLLKPPLDLSSPMLTIVDTTWRALLFMILLPIILIFFVILALGAILQSRPRR